VQSKSEVKSETWDSSQVKINGMNSPWCLLSSLDTKQIVQSWLLRTKTCSFIRLKYSSIRKSNSGLFSALSGLDLKLLRTEAALQCVMLGP